MNFLNVVDLDSRRKIFPDFNVFNHTTNPTTDPIEQREIARAVQKAPNLSSTEKLVLLEIVAETVWKGFYYTFVTQKEIAENCGLNVRSLRRILTSLIEKNWIAIKKSEKYSKRNCTDFNIEKVMALSKRPQKRTKSPVAKKIEDSESSQKRTKLNSSKEELICGNGVTTFEPGFKKEKRKRSCRALAQTWNSAISSYFPHLDARISRKEYVKFKALADKLHLEDEELHEFIEWNVKNWQYCWRRFRSKEMPKIPNHNWFIACRNKFYEIWWENLKDLKPHDERVVELKDYVKIDSREKWYGHRFEDEYFDKQIDERRKASLTRRKNKRKSYRNK